MPLWRLAWPPLFVDPCSPNGYDPFAVAGPDREEHPTQKAQPAPSDDDGRAAASETAVGSSSGQSSPPDGELGEGQLPLPEEDTDPLPGPETPAEDSAGEATGAAYAEFDNVKLDVFEGPLDLLLHLIRKHELDILDIPVGFITEKYLEYLALMHSLHIDVISEYLVIAATLTYIKSKMLLPPDPSLEEGEDGDLFDSDPRADLVRRLLEYQKYKHTASQLGDRPRLDRDTFVRGTAEPTDPGPTQLAPVNVFRLFDAFEQVLKRANQTADHQVLFERISITERIVELTEMLGTRRRVRFADLFTVERDGQLAIESSRLVLVLTFLAMLEMCKMGVAKVTQSDQLEELYVEFTARRSEGDAIPDAAAPSDEGGEGDGAADAQSAPQNDDEGAGAGQRSASEPAESEGGSDRAPASGDDSETP
jgi:segregation and condensation protein A